MIARTLLVLEGAIGQALIDRSQKRPSIDRREAMTKMRNSRSLPKDAASQGLRMRHGRGATFGHRTGRTIPGTGERQPGYSKSQGENPPERLRAIRALNPKGWKKLQQKRKPSVPTFADRVAKKKKAPSVPSFGS